MTTTPPSPNYAKAVKVLMAESGLSTAAIAAASGFGREYISRVRSGRVSPLPRLDLWAAVFGLTPSAFVSRAESYAADPIPPRRRPHALEKMANNRPLSERNPH